MNPTLRDLRTALEEEAVRAPLPSADALVAGAAHRVQAARRRRAGLTAAVAVVVLVAGLVSSTHVGRRSSEPAHPGPFRVVPSGGEFPAYSLGAKRLLVVTAPALERLKGSVSVPTTPGRELTVRLLCRPTTITDFDQRTVAKVTGPSGKAIPASCLPGPEIPMGDAAIGASGSARTTVDLDVFINHAGFTPGAGPSFAKATVTAAIYESVPWSAYRLPPRPAGLEKSLDYAWTSPTDRKAVVLAPSADPNAPRSATIPGTRLARSITLDVRGPGRLKLLVNGNPVHDTGPGGPRVEDGWLEFFDFTHTGLTVDAASTGNLRVQVVPDGFAGADWRVVVGRQQ